MHTMKSLTAILLAAALLLSLAACGSQPSPTQAPGTASTQSTATGPKKVQAADLLEAFTPQPVAEKKADEAFIRAGYELAAKLFGKIYQAETEQKTLLVSPLSILTALTMTANGAAGNTLKEMEDIPGSGSLNLEDLNAYLHTYLNTLPSSEKAKFSFANGIWFKDQADFVVKDAFLQKNTDYFKAAIRKAPFDDTTVREINQWVDQHTDHMIPKLLNQLKEEDRMLLVNALVFDAKWADPFKEAHCWEAVFTNLNGQENLATYMSGEVYSYLEDEEAVGFVKDYEGGTYRFVALLPKDEKGFESWIKGMSGEHLQALLAGVSQEKTYISLPKFSYDYSASLSKVLMDLGIKDSFSDSADFRGISEETKLYISDVIHKTHIDLDSDGTRAAAVTAVMVDAGAMIEDPKYVNLDRPFMYMIIDTATNLPIFMGTVTGFEE